MEDSEKAIIRTLLYSDIFDYPLKKDEVWKYLISEKNIDKKTFDNRIGKINSIVFRNREFLHMEKKESAVVKRSEKYEYNMEKLKLAQETADKLSVVPTVLFIGISGSLSMMSSSSADDIDLFVVTKKNTAWITRLLLVLTLKILGKHRKRGDKNVRNKFCLNMIVDENNLLLPPKFRNLYTAHEIAQLIPVIERNKIYKKFIEKNSWIGQFLPNSLKELRTLEVKEAGSSLNSKIIERILRLSILESIARISQQLLMKKNLTREIIEDGFIALHPRDYKNIILSSYKSRLSQYGL